MQEDRFGGMVEALGNLLLEDKDGALSVPVILVFNIIMILKEIY